MKLNSNEEITSKIGLPKNARGPAWFFLLWAASVLLLVFIVTVICTAWAVRHVSTATVSRLSAGQARMVIAIAEFPGLVHEAVYGVMYQFGSDPQPLLIDRKSTEQPYWVRRFPAPEDHGYLLLSGVDPVAKHSIVQLLRISDGKTVARWDPDWEWIYEKTTAKKFEPKVSPLRMRAVHPLLLADGDIIFNTDIAMVRLSTCSRKPVWILDEVMHHSNELDVNGAIWTPSVSQDGFADNPWLRDRIRDDALAHISTDGKVLERLSFVRILRDNGLLPMLLGNFGVRLNEDPIHLNQIQIAPSDSGHWKRGDLLISARHLSTIFLYRPSTGRILWQQTGPWLNQHSVDFVDDHRISVFSNNIITSVPKEYAFMSPSDTNRVYLYDFNTGQASQPFAALLAETRPVTITAGRARILPDGGLFIEESDYSRHLRFTHDRLLWSRVNDYDDKHIGAASWSRYLTEDEVRGPLQSLASRQCAAVASTGRSFPRSPQ